MAVTKVLVRDEAPGQQPTGYPWAVACAPCAGHHGHMGGLEGDTQAGLRLCPTCAWVSSCPGHSLQPHRTGGGGLSLVGPGSSCSFPAFCEAQPLQGPCGMARALQLLGQDTRHPLHCPLTFFLRCGRQEWVP